jgi:hypothetical protein
VVLAVEATLTKGAPTLVYGQLGGNSRVHVASDGVHVTDEAGTDRVHIGRIGESVNAEGTITGEYGLRVVSSDGSTVIIDGTSDMYRIAATGTFTLVGPAGSSGNCVNTTMTVVVATDFTYPPHVEVSVETATNQAAVTPYWSAGLNGTISLGFTSSSRVVNTDETEIRATWFAQSDQSALTDTFRYRVLEQTAI